MQILISQNTKIIIEHVASPKLEQEYIDSRDELWEEQLAKYTRENKQLWNGEVYCVRSFLQTTLNEITLQLCTCEYKDIIYKNNVTPQKIIEKFGSDAICQHISVDCLPVTRDGFFILGLRDAKTIAKPNALGLIGGTLNKDEMDIETFSDIEVFANKEVSEETTFEPNASDFRLHSINQYNAKYQFLFTFTVEMNGSEITSEHAREEFVDMVTLTEGELKNFEEAELSAVIHLKQYPLIHQ